MLNTLAMSGCLHAAVCHYSPLLRPSPDPKRGVTELGPHSSSASPSPSNASKSPNISAFSFCATMHSLRTFSNRNLRHYCSHRWCDFVTDGKTAAEYVRAAAHLVINSIAPSLAGQHKKLRVRLAAAVPSAAVRDASRRLATGPASKPHEAALLAACTSVSTCRPAA